ncbi:hypothetical protein CV102_17975 [Natronococcus pandeyae]|uniref:DUF2254 domain-containing protein n=1 Tax=Natronococcus pandeyae TaxID=2055836 RepID=A0A8J8TNY7_9EURY|nr:DUF2254 family protein [Natronococcus pandeyae]TYL37206.1 hypothetical protein CV102_17975 [Natronococcus pandeyae]
MTQDRLSHRLRGVLSRLPVGLLALSIGILGGALAISVTPYAIYVPATVGEFIGTLAVAQASVLAIVFSVVILAVQLTASKYSTQITEFYVKSPVFIVTFGLFLVSISFDMALLYSYPLLSESAVRTMVYVAAGLGLVVAIWLVYFIRFTFTQLTPKGIVSMFERELTPARSRRLLRANQGDNPVETEMDHPLLPLHSLTVQAIQNEERFMAFRALRELGSQMVQFLEDGERSVDTDLLESMYLPVLTVYVPEIIEIGHERKMEEIAEHGFEWMSRIGRAGTQTSQDRVARIASDGFEGIIDRYATDPTKHQPLVTAWEKWGQLVKELCLDAETDTIQHVFSGLEQQLNRIENQEYEAWVRQQILFSFFTDIKRCHETLLERFGPTVAALDVSWDRRFLPMNGDRARLAAQLLLKCRNLFVVFSSIVLAHRIETDDYPIRAPSFQGIWADICSATARHASRGYTRTIYEIYIEVAVIAILAERTAEDPTVDVGEQIEMWAATLARIARAEEKEPLVAAFDAVLDDDTMRYLSVGTHTPIADTDGYPELVERLRTVAEA